MEFRWIERNIEKVWLHGVTTQDAEDVVEGARSPFPRNAGDGRFLVWGRTAGGRYLQVVYLQDPDDALFVIHARPLESGEKRRFRRRRRRR